MIGRPTLNFVFLIILTAACSNTTMKYKHNWFVLHERSSMYDSNYFVILLYLLIARFVSNFVIILRVLKNTETLAVRIVLGDGKPFDAVKSHFRARKTLRAASGRLYLTQFIFVVSLV